MSRAEQRAERMERLVYREKMACALGCSNCQWESSEEDWYSETEILFWPSCVHPENEDGSLWLCPIAMKEGA